MARPDGNGSVDRLTRREAVKAVEPGRGPDDSRRANRRRPSTLSLTLVRELDAALVARQAIHERLGEVLPVSTLADVMLIVSELVNNAVLHGSGGIQVHVSADDRLVSGGVLDEGGGFERPGHAGDGAPGRLGLLIVERLCESWGILPDRTHVWFELPVIGA